MKNIDKIPRSFGTHDGTFHADEVTACALLILFNLIDREKIVRTRDSQVLQACEYVCDVGGVYDPKKKLFDHHQVEYNGTMSSAGMVLLYLKDTGTLSPHEYDFFNGSLIMGVDDHDNGRDPQILGLSSYSHIIASYNPIMHEPEPPVLDKAFQEALDFALGYLKRIHEKHTYILSCQQIVADAMKSQDVCLYFDQNIPWIETFFELDGEHHPAQFIIMPSGKHWKLRGIPPNFENRMKVRFPLPLEWAGLLDEELKKVSSISGAVFCHKGRFISVWETREDAKKALDYTLKKMKEVRR